MMRCKVCKKVTKSPKSLTWDVWQTCPRCVDTHSLNGLKHDTPIITKKVNPVDFYLTEYTTKEVMRNG